MSWGPTRRPAILRSAAASGAEDALDRRIVYCLDRLFEDVPRRHAEESSAGMDEERAEGGQARTTDDAQRLLCSDHDPPSP
jgi:hypothetical protein